MTALIITAADAVAVYVALRIRTLLKSASAAVDRIIREEVTERRASVAGDDRSL